MTDKNDKVSSTLASSLVTDMVPILTIGTFNTMDLPMVSRFEADVHVTTLYFLKSVCSLVEPFSRVDLSGILL